MQTDAPQSGPVLRYFEARAKPGQAETLKAKFLSVSADVVRDQPGNLGYFLGRSVVDDTDVVVFASVWADLNAIKARFGAAWRSSYMPDGYDALIDACSVRHIDLGGGWHVRGMTRVGEG
jgi:quinol monooxygenase YgiN